MAEKKKNKIILLGLDALDPKILNGLIAEGKLPNFRKLIDRGFYSELKTFKPALSPAIWTSIMTGKLPEKHGIQNFNYLQFAGKFYPIPINLWIPRWMDNKFIHGFVKGMLNLLARIKLVEIYLPASTMRKAKAVWDILTDNNLCSGTVGFWATWPAEKVNGAMISEHLNFARANIRAEEDVNVRRDYGLTYPSPLGGELKRFDIFNKKFSKEHFKDFMQLSDDEMTIFNKTDKADERNHIGMFKHHYCSDEFNVHSSFYLLNKFVPDFFAVLLCGLDGMCHNFWRYREPWNFSNITKLDILKFGRAIDNYYIYLDKILGKFAEAEKDATIIVVSDHGFEYNGKKQFEFNYEGHMHGPNGIFIIGGRNIKKFRNNKTITPCDITPTVLYLLGLPVARDFDGRVIEEAINNNFLKTNKIKLVDSYEDKKRKTYLLKSNEDEAIKQRLKSLGYL